jgi:hypothetical protein
MAYGRPAVDNLGVINRGVDLWMKRVEEMVVAEYRVIVWKAFNRILNQTPQFSGYAVANWNIGVDAPDFTEYEYAGKVKVQARPNSAFSENILVARQRGDRAAIQSAQRRNRPKLDLIKRSSRVYITNSARGDTDLGRTSTDYYVEALQDPTYWVKKLREVNRPYETAQESIMYVMERERQGGRVALRRIGGENFDDN